MIDLAFEFGIPAHELGRRLPEREFALYQQYATKRMLPARRIEMHLAQVCSVLAQVNGNKDVSISDFLFSASEEVELEGDDLLDYLQFSPRNKG